MIATTEFLPRIIPHVMGCSNPMALQALVDSAIAFCDDSLVIRQRLDPQLTVYGQPELDVTPPPQQVTARVMKVWANGVPMAPVPSDDVGNVLSMIAPPRCFYTLMDNGATKANLFPAPDGVYRVVVELVLRPERSAVTLSDALYSTWMDHVVSGALGRLMSTPDQPFTNLALGQSYASKALYLSRRARVEGSYGQVKSTTRVKQRPFV